MHSAGCVPVHVVRFYFPSFVDDEDRDEGSRESQERNIVSKFLLASLSTVDTSKYVAIVS